MDKLNPRDCENLLFAREINDAILLNISRTYVGDVQFILLLEMK